MITLLLHLLRVLPFRAFNLGLLMRKAFGRGTPRGLQGRRSGVGALEIAFGIFVERVWMAATRLWPVSRRMPWVVRTYLLNSRARLMKSASSTTGCYDV